eukprot:3714135-Rhodomonas_salina.1
MMGLKGSRNVSSRSRLGVVAINKMEGIELEAHHETEFEDVGFMAELDHNAKVSKLKARWCVHSDEEY